MNSVMLGGGGGVKQRNLTRESRISTYFNYSGMTDDPLRYATSLLVIYRSNIGLVARNFLHSSESTFLSSLISLRSQLINLHSLVFTLQPPLILLHSQLFSLSSTSSLSSPLFSLHSSVISFHSKIISLHSFVSTR